MGKNTISQKIDNYVKQNLQTLKKEEAKTGQKKTKYNIAEEMLKSGKLSKAEFAQWCGTTEGAVSKSKTSIFGVNNSFGEESYLDSMTSFSQKSPVQQQATISSHQMKLNETVAERKKKAAELTKHIKQQQVAKQTLNPNESLKEQKFKDHINSLPEVEETYTELMNDIKFIDLKNASEDEKLGFFKKTEAKIQYRKEAAEAMLKQAQEILYEADKNGTLSEKGKAFFNALMADSQVLDEKLGVTKFKEVMKEMTFINAGADKLTELVDDGDDNNLSIAEHVVEDVKAFGRTVDNLAGTAGIGMAASLTAASAAAAEVGVGTAFSLLVHAYFAYEGADMALEGISEAMNAKTKEEAGAAGEKLSMGLIMLGGTAKSARDGYKNYKANKTESVNAKNSQQELLNFKGMSNTEVRTALKEYANNNNLILKNNSNGPLFREGSVELYDKNGHKILSVSQKEFTGENNYYIDTYNYNADGNIKDITTYKDGILFSKTEFNTKNNHGVLCNKTTDYQTGTYTLNKNGSAFKFNANGKLISFEQTIDFPHKVGDFKYYKSSQVKLKQNDNLKEFDKNNRTCPSIWRTTPDGKINITFDTPHYICSGMSTIKIDPNTLTYELSPGQNFKTDIVRSYKPSQISDKLYNDLTQDSHKIPQLRKICNNPEIVNQLANYKIDGKNVFTPSDINFILKQNFMDTPNGSRLLQNVLNDSKTIEIIKNANNPLAGLWKACFPPQ